MGQNFSADFILQSGTYVHRMITGGFMPVIR
jgi:hypothetical protein